MAGSLDEVATLRTAGIIAVGTELLTPDRLDTNSLYLTAQLNGAGIDVVFKAVSRDDAADLAREITHGLSRCDLLVITGGLGPTSDDVTREAVAAALARPLHEDAGLLTTIRARFERRGVPMPAINRTQAVVPRGARVLPNANGTAPGLWIDVDARVVVCLPGPPRELEPMFAAHVLPAIRARAGRRIVMRRVIRVAGLPESHVEELAHPAYAPLARGTIPIATTILASPGVIELQFSARGDDEPAMDHALAAGVAAVARAIGPAVFSTDGRKLEEVVGAALLAHNLRLATAESCTGGMVSMLMTDVPGSSGWFSGGAVAYGNDVKVDVLGVDPELIARHGAVSEPVARAMADAARHRFGADVGVGVTGIAGPSGGSPEKPVGTVVIAVSTADTGVVRTHRLAGDRALVRRQSAMLALDAVRRVVEARATTRMSGL